MTTCERCHTENLDGAQYCDECGAALPGRGGVAALAREPVEAPRAAAPQEPRAEAVEVHSGRHSKVFAASRTSVSGRERARGDGEASPGGPHAKLVIHRGRSVGKEFPLNEDESHIGRWDADGGIFPDVDLDADDPEAKVSRRHARISRRGEQYFIEDLGSTNGTFVNRGRRLLPGDRQVLRDGDEVIVGKTFLRFQVLQK